LIFTLEALQAEKGDSLILHFGKPTAPRFIVIDGGPAVVYGNTLKPRLEQIRGNFKNKKDGKLDIDMVMVSHIDDDHINGILRWFEELQDKGLPFNIGTLWFNSFDEAIGNLDKELKSALAALTVKSAPVDSKAIVASVGQGRSLRSTTDLLGIGFNEGFIGLVMAPEKIQDAVLDIGAGLKFHVLCPSRKRLEALGTEWEAKIKDSKNKAMVAAFSDKSIANLSSIVVLAECGGKRMLLTGDARGDDILFGLDHGGLLKSGKIHVDLFKFPHHGSNRNMTLEFLRQVTADHYVISANGENDNPDPEIFGWLAKARGKDPYTIYITNEKLREPKKKRNVEKIVKQALADNPSPKRKVVFRNDTALSLKVDLLDAVKF
jgi:hypothetical protein